MLWIKCLFWFGALVVAEEISGILDVAIFNATRDYNQTEEGVKITNDSRDFMGTRKDGLT